MGGILCTSSRRGGGIPSSGLSCHSTMNTFHTYVHLPVLTFPHTPLAQARERPSFPSHVPVQHSTLPLPVPVHSCLLTINRRQGQIGKQAEARRAEAAGNASVTTLAYTHFRRTTPRDMLRATAKPHHTYLRGTHAIALSIIAAKTPSAHHRRYRLPISNACLALASFTHLARICGALEDGQAVDGERAVNVYATSMVGYSVTRINRGVARKPKIYCLTAREHRCCNADAGRKNRQALPTRAAGRRRRNLGAGQAGAGNATSRVRRLLLQAASCRAQKALRAERRRCVVLFGSTVLFC